MNSVRAAGPQLVREVPDLLAVGAGPVRRPRRRVRPPPMATTARRGCCGPSVWHADSDRCPHPHDLVDGASASSRPFPRTTSRRRSLHLAHQVLDTSTVRPWSARTGRAAVPAHPVRVETVDRLVETQHRRVAEQRAGDAQPLPHAERQGTAGFVATPRPGRRWPAPHRPWAGTCPLPLPYAVGARDRTAGVTARASRARRPRARVPQFPVWPAADQRPPGGGRSTLRTSAWCGLAGSVGAEEPVTGRGRCRRSGRRPPPWTRTVSSVRVV